MNGLGRSVSASLANSVTSRDALTPSFDLGALHTTQDFYFLLKNSGNADLQNVSIGTSIPALIASPHHIDILQPFDSTSVSPIVRLSIQHGKSAQGPGLAPLLSQGAQTATLTVSTELDTLAADVSFDAKVMDINLLVNDVIVDFENTNGAVSTNKGGLGFARRYQVNPASIVKIQNTGNVAIDATYDRYDSAHTTYLPPINERIEPTQTLTVPTDYPVFVSLAGNTITDDARLQLGNDGIAYFYIDLQ